MTQSRRDNACIQDKFQNYQQQKAQGYQGHSYLDNKDKQAEFKAERKEKVYRNQVKKLFDAEG